MTTPALPAALRACGIYALEASAELLIAHAGWLDREDFTAAFIRTSRSLASPATDMAVIDWPAAITALDTGQLPAPPASRKSSGSQPASAKTIPSASPHPSPASTTATLSSWSRPYSTHQADASHRHFHDHLEVQRIVAQRCKLSGMRWTLPGAYGILTLRCLDASDRWEETWTPPGQPRTGAA